jgi:anti-sigma B factor antagonist
MELTERTEGGVTILDLVGRLRVEDGASDFRASIVGLIAKGCCCLVLNLERCPYVDSAGLGELATALVKARKAGGQVVLVNVPDRVLELLRITRLTDVFTICQDERSALAAVQSV